MPGLGSSSGVTPRELLGVKAEPFGCGKWVAPSRGGRSNTSWRQFAVLLHPDLLTRGAFCSKEDAAADLDPQRGHLSLPLASSRAPVTASTGRPRGAPRDPEALARSRPIRGRVTQTGMNLVRPHLVELYAPQGWRPSCQRAGSTRFVQGEPCFARG